MKMGSNAIIKRKVVVQEQARMLAALFENRRHFW
jgi:hypothetical protein